MEGYYREFFLDKRSLKADIYSIKSYETFHKIDISGKLYGKSEHLCRAAQ
jgi:hypothetical protein